MAELVTIARPYAKAVFNYAKQHEALDAWSNQLIVMANALVDERVQSFLSLPKHTRDERAQWLVDTLGSEINKDGQRLVELLSHYDRLNCLPDIALLFEQLKAQAENSMDVNVLTSKEIGSEALAELKMALEKRFNSEVRISQTLDATLIGGAIIQAGDTVIDGSVRGRLNRLAHDLGGP